MSVRLGRLAPWLISTHAPHARCDFDKVNVNDIDYNFYSRTSCEVRRNICYGLDMADLFLLTHLMRGATWLHGWKRDSEHFYSRTSCEVRQKLDLS